jgi:hypothetical protein
VVDAANLERLGVPTVVIGLPQLLNTVGRATARSMNIPRVPFVEVPGDLHHALDYIPDDSPFWAEAVDVVAPLAAKGLLLG